ncbi:MAG: 2-phosphosulfolactate phosphatase [Planctomycetaceae bacterium]|jgi:2-phosphosulfolactate phosphatase|nr:2-phosphosulfolactate phosphatase [Planctomycetaceae bacterium]
MNVKSRFLNVYALPSAVTAGALDGAGAAVIDVLRATSVAAFAAASGVDSIIPLTDIDEARYLKTVLEKEKPGSVLLGGERFGLPIDGFDLGNSPQHYTPEKVKGKTLIQTTTNGTVAVEAAKPAAKIILASFLNAQTVVNVLQNEERIAIVCAGTNGVETEEDLLFAGCLVSRLLSLNSAWQQNETAIRVQQLWEERNPGEPLTETLRRSCGG